MECYHWNNENILEFIELLHEEPHIWNHKRKDHKNRKLLNQAWVRIANKFSVPCPIEELKKKRNSLLTQYRDCLRKKKEKESQSGGESYTPSWFAFDALDSYMGHLYDYQPKINGEAAEMLLVEDSELSESDHSVGYHPVKFQESTEKQPLKSPVSRETIPERSVSRESTSRKPKESIVDPLSESFLTVKKRQSEMQYSPIAKKQMVEAFPHNKVEETAAECDLYGQLLAEKLKALDVDDRLVIMNEIDNLVFKFMLDIRKRNNLSRSANLALLNQAHSDNRQPMDVPGPSTTSNRSQDHSQINEQNSQSNSINEVPFRIIKTEIEQ